MIYQNYKSFLMLGLKQLNKGVERDDFEKYENKFNKIQRTLDQVYL